MVFVSRNLLSSICGQQQQQQHFLKTTIRASHQFDKVFTRMASDGNASSIAQDKRQAPQLPSGSWCTHMHVATSKYPLSPRATYKMEHDHTLEDALKYYSKWGVRNLVFVQPSIYGTDNSCILDCLREITPDHGRGVVEIDPATITQEELRRYHDAGVRGVRVNFVSSGRNPTDDEITAELEAYAKIIRPLKTWQLEVYMPLERMGVLINVVPNLGVKFSTAHCGSPKLPSKSTEPVDPYSLNGFKSLITLLQQGNTWVKISAPYRLTQDPEMKNLEPLIKELLSQAPDRVVWAGDWPHTRFEGRVDLSRFVEKCFEWTAGPDQEERRDKLFRRNAEDLFDVR